VCRRVDREEAEDLVGSEYVQGIGAVGNRSCCAIGDRVLMMQGMLKVEFFC